MPWFGSEKSAVVGWDGKLSLFRTEMPIDAVQREYDRPDGLVVLSENGKWCAVQDGKAYYLQHIDDILRGDEYGAASKS